MSEYKELETQFLQLVDDVCAIEKKKTKSPNKSQQNKKQAKKLVDEFENKILSFIDNLGNKESENIKEINK